MVSINTLAACKLVFAFSILYFEREYLSSLGMKEYERVYGAVIIGYPANGLPNRNLMARKGNEVTYID